MANPPTDPDALRDPLDIDTFLKLSTIDRDLRAVVEELRVRGDSQAARATVDLYERHGLEALRQGIFSLQKARGYEWITQARMEHKPSPPEVESPPTTDQRQRIGEALLNLLPDPSHLASEDRLIFERYLGSADPSDRQPYQDALDHIRVTALELKQLTSDLARYVHEARAAGSSWNKIGVSAGMTASQAMRKWDPKSREKQRAYTASKWRAAKQATNDGD